MNQFPDLMQLGGAVDLSRMFSSRRKRDVSVVADKAGNRMKLFSSDISFSC